MLGSDGQMSWATGKRMKTPFFRATILLLFLLLGLSALPANVAASDRMQDENDIKAVIDAYFTLRYEALKSLIPTDFLAVADSTDAGAANWRRAEADRLGLRFTIARTFGDYVVDYKFFLDYIAIDVKNAKATVTLLESNEITYSSNPTDPSRMADLRHVIVLSHHQNRWGILRDDYQDELSDAIANSSQSEIDQNIINNHNGIHPDRSGDGETPPHSAAADLKRFTYFNSAALAFANAYWNSVGPVPTVIRDTPGWDSSWPTNYKQYPRDCNNFISQAIFQGTSFTASDANYPHPDSSHYTTQWYYKFSTTTDGSLPWVNVGSFYAFLTGNLYGGLGRGPAGLRVDLCSPSLIYGNPIFMKTSTGWAHTVIIATNSGCNIAVNSHNVNYYHAPLSIFSAYSWYPIYIAGYFK